MALSTVSAVLHAIGLGKLAARAARAAQPLRARAPGRADPRRRQEARPDHGGAGHASPAARSQNANRRRAPLAAPPAGSSCTSASTTPPAWPTPRCSPTRRRPPRSASCAARVAFYAAHGITVAARDDRQRLLLPLRRSRRRLPRARHPPPPHPPLPAPHQRQGRALHPDHVAGWAYGAIYATSTNAPPPLTAGSGPTTIDDHTAPSATSAHQLASTS